MESAAVEIAIEIERREWTSYTEAQRVSQEWTHRRQAAAFRSLPLAAQSVIRSNVIESRAARLSLHLDTSRIGCHAPGGWNRAGAYPCPSYQCLLLLSPVRARLAHPHAR